MSLLACLSKGHDQHGTATAAIRHGLVVTSAIYLDFRATSIEAALTSPCKSPADYGGSNILRARYFYARSFGVEACKLFGLLALPDRLDGLVLLFWPRDAGARKALGSDTGGTARPWGPRSDGDNSTWHNAASLGRGIGGILFRSSCSDGQQAIRPHRLSRRVDR
jgi:hypothetical protein